MTKTQCSNKIKIRASKYDQWWLSILNVLFHSDGMKKLVLSRLSNLKNTASTAYIKNIIANDDRADSESSSSEAKNLLRVLHEEKPIMFSFDPQKHHRGYWAEFYLPQMLNHLGFKDVLILDAIPQARGSSTYNLFYSRINYGTFRYLVNFIPLAEWKSTKYIPEDTQLVKQLERTPEILLVNTDYDLAKHIDVQYKVFFTLCLILRVVTTYNLPNLFIFMTRMIGGLLTDRSQSNKSKPSAKHKYDGELEFEPVIVFNNKRYVVDSMLVSSYHSATGFSKDVTSGIICAGHPYIYNKGASEDEGCTLVAHDWMDGKQIFCLGEDSCHVKHTKTDNDSACYSNFKHPRVYIYIRQDLLGKTSNKSGIKRKNIPDISSPSSHEVGK